MRLLIAEDNEVMREGLSQLLGGEGYDCASVPDGHAAWALFDREPFPLVLLDVVMPGRDGLTLCRDIRKRAPATQILILSARGESFDKTRGIDLGADDYVAKPFCPDELRARVAAMARRAERAAVAPVSSERRPPEADRTAFRMGDLWIDPVRFTASRDGAALTLSRRELAVLALLHREAGRPVSRDRLFDECWDRDYFPNSRALDQYISALRRRIEKDPARPRIIRTVRGIGYAYDR